MVTAPLTSIEFCASKRTNSQPDLAVTAAVLLVFVSVAVIYLSTIEWRDRRRRQGSIKSSS